MRDGTDTLGQRFAAGGLAVLTALVLAFLVAPILIVIPLSFSSGSFLYYPLPGLSLRWYHDFFTSTFWLPSVWNSLIVGISATVLATALGTLAALGMWRARFPGRRLILALVIAPMVVPVVIIAVGVYFAFAPLGLNDGYAGLILAHTTLGVPFVVVTVLATLSGFDRTLLRACREPRRAAADRVPSRNAAPHPSRSGVRRGIRLRGIVRRSRRRPADCGAGPAHAAATDVRGNQRQH
jgi:putative spermidine/putrescine transport system permease protein